MDLYLQICEYLVTPTIMGLSVSSKIKLKFEEVKLQWL